MYTAHAAQTLFAIKMGKESKEEPKPEPAPAEQPPAEPLKEYSEKVISQLTDKFTQENPELSTEQVKEYIKRFDQIKNNLSANKRDIFQYSWSDLEDTIKDNLQSKRIKAGKLNDGDVTNAELLYNQNNIRVYEGGSKKSCIKYGNGYSFCISARGSRNLYARYRVGSEEGSYEESGPASIYFVFDDSRSSDKGKNGFIDPTHLLVILVEEGEAFSVTEANNAGEELFSTFEEMAEVYPQLNGLKNILQYKPIGDSDIDVKIYNLERQKEKKLDNLLDEYPALSIISGKDTKSGKSTATKLLKGELQLYFYRLLAYDKKNGQLNPYMTIQKNYAVAKNEKEFEKNISGWIDNVKKLNLTPKLEYKLVPLDDEHEEILSTYIEISNKYDREILKLKLINETSINEYSNKLVNDLTAKFQQEKPNLGVNIIQSYINRFSQIKDSPRVTEKDITKYNWKDLETTVDANQPKRIKAGKINDGEPSKDANLVYNQNGLRIYVGKTKNACIKYGNGYSFCISARGDDNLYYDYRYEESGTPYFVFDDTKSSEQDKNGNFVDITHLLVIFVHPDPNGEFVDANYNMYSDNGIDHYTVTTADNPGEDFYSFFKNIEDKYPRLKGLKNIFKDVEVDPKEKAEYELDKKYNSLLGNLNDSYDYKNGKNYQEGFRDKQYVFRYIKTADNKIDDILSGKMKSYKIIATLKYVKKEDRYATSYISQNRIVKAGSDIKDEYKKFADNILMSLAPPGITLKDVLNDWNINSEELGLLKEYMEEVKQLVDEYRKELAKIKLMNEGLKSKLQRLDESETGTIGEFIKYACKNLAIQNPPRSLTLSYDTNQVKDRRSFGYFDPNDNKIWVYVKNRNITNITIDIASRHKQCCSITLRSISCVD